MLSLRETHTAELLWTQPDRKVQEYEMRAGDVPVLRLRWDSKGGLASAEAAGVGWRIEREGSWHPSIVIRSEDRHVDFATFRGNWRGGGTLEFWDGRVYTWNNTNFLHTAWAWMERAGQPLLRFKGKAMTIEPVGRALPDILLLAALSWYLNITNNRSDGTEALGAIAAM